MPAANFRTVPLGIPMRRMGAFDPRFRTQRPEMPVDLWQIVYDRMNIASTVPASIRFFSIALGGSTTLIRGTATGTFNKTERDTNWSTSGQDINAAYEIHGIGKIYVPLQQAPTAAATVSIPDDICKLDYNGYLNFKTNNVQHAVMPLSLIPSPTSLRLSMATTATNSTMVSGGGVSSNKEWYMLQVPIVIEPGQTIEATLNWDTAASLTLAQTFDVYWIFAAYKRKPS